MSNWIPSWKWLWTPSGGYHAEPSTWHEWIFIPGYFKQPRRLSFLAKVRSQLEAPLLAHPIGGVMAWAASRFVFLAGTDTAVLANAVALMGIWQAAKYDSLIPLGAQIGKPLYSIREVVWRVALGLVAAAPLAYLV